MTRFASVALFALGGVCVAAVQQTAAPQGPPTFRAGVDIVRVDVSVLDKNRRPVLGLLPGDFTILEDGKPQPVVAFSPVEIPDSPPVPVVAGRKITWMRDVAPDVQTNDIAAGRLFVMLIDDALIPQDPKIVANARQVARAVIDHLGPADRVSIVFSQQGELAQGFTNDRTKLLATVDRIQPGRAQYTFGWDTIRERNSIGETDPERYRNPHPVSDADSGARVGSLRTLQSVAEAMMASPERRKALIYLSPGIPMNGGVVASAGLVSGRTQQIREANVQLAELVPDLFREMQRADIVVYAIDPTGPNGIAPYVSRTIGAIPVMHEYTSDIVVPDTQEGPIRPCDNYKPSAGIPPCFVPGADELGQFVGQLSLDFLQTTAENTGGRAIIGNERFDEAVTQIFVENGSYYMLAYRLPPGSPPGNMHHLKVLVNRPGVDVRARNAYYTPDPVKETAKLADVSPTKQAILGPFPKSDLPLRVALAPIAVPGKDEAAVTIALQLEREAMAVPISDTVQVETRAFTTDGSPRGIQLQQAFIALRPSATKDLVQYEALSSIALKPGRYQLRIGVYSATNDAAGSIYADVDVPDFAKEPLSLSGVVLSTTPALPASPIEVLSKLVPLVPTASRAFQKLDRVTAFVRVYEGLKAPAADAAMTVRITNDHGEDIVARTDTLEAARFSSGARSVDYRFDVPIMTLTRGPYLLTFEAAAGATTSRRDVRFTIR